MDKIEFRKIGSLGLHPDNVKIFGFPTDEPNYEEIREDIRKRGLQEPLIILNDGTILSGHIRFSGVCWTLEQRGLTSEQIKEELIAVRVHEDFGSKEEELEYLMSANDKRRQLDPRRMATSLERLEQILEASESKKGKRGEALKKLADRLGVSFKLATTYRIIFSSKIVPEDYKDKVNAKSLAPSTVIEAIKFAEESSKRESRAPSSDDVVIYLKTPRSKTTLADTIREAAKGGTSVTMSTAAPTPAPKPAKLTTIEVAPEPPKVEEKPAPEPQKAEEVLAKNVHTEHCCLEHGCKYGDDDCPVSSGKQKQSGPCETCGLISEGYFDSDPYESHDDQDPPETPAEKISSARRLLKESLKVLVLDDEVTSDLKGLHTELTAYLTAMNIISQVTAVPQQGLTIPTDAMELIGLCTSLVQGIDTSPVDPQEMRDALLDLMGFIKLNIDRLTTTKRAMEPNGLYCPECLEPQLNSPSGATCNKGHGGCVGITEEQADQIKMSQELSKEKFKCCFCGSQVETADSYATHATCPKCGLVDTSDIEPVVKTVKSKDELEIDLDLLDDVLGSDVAPTTASTPTTSDGISADELAALLGQEEPQKAPAPKAPEPKKIEPKKIEPKKAPVVQAKSNGAEDAESALVTSVIDDFELELQKAGVPTTA